MMRAVLTGVALLAPLWAQNYEFDLQSGGGWIDTAIDLQPGDSLHFDASGSLQYAHARQFNGPEGLPRALGDLIRDLPFNDSGRGAVLGRIGSNEADRSFLIGRELDKKAPIA